MKNPETNHLPDSLAAIVAHHWEAISDATSDEQKPQLNALDGVFWQQLTTVLVGSDYVASQFRRHPDWLIALPQWIQQSPNYLQELQQRVANAETEADLHRELRLFRHEHMVRIIWQDLNRLVPMTTTTQSLSALADACIQAALDWLYDSITPAWGTPYSRGGERQHMVVIGMGKLGACELNLSSDIDLIFSFPQYGETRDGRKCLDNQVFFNRLGQKLIQALDNNTADGFVFRVDMRLRPYGKSGILCPCFAAMEEYYLDQGRDWERYALIKARIVGGDQEQGEALMEELRPFVFRKYIDYSAFESLREMKAMINSEVRRRNLQQNVKLGPGGIREIEFIAQAFQLIRGGHDRHFQARELNTILGLLPDAIDMSKEVADQLIDANVFLRNTEHCIQAVADKQTQELPVDEVAQLRLAYAMGFTHWDEFYQTLSLHRERVSRHFTHTIAPENPFCEIETTHSLLVGLWEGNDEQDTALKELESEGFDDPERAYKLIADLRQNRTLKGIQSIGRQRLNKLMPLLLDAVSEQENATETLGRCLQLVEEVLRRSAYLLLLIENPEALKQLVKLCSASPWISNQLARQPILLDELLDASSLYSPPNRDKLEDELRQHLLRIPEDDTEQFMNALRYFKSAHILRVAAAEVSGTLPLMKVSDYLTFIAEVILQGTLEIAWQNVTQKHGFPLRADGSRCDPDFLMVGYGKVGGIELSYGSDLDLVFIHDGAMNKSTDGEKPVDTQVFFTRLGQRIINILNTNTTSGQLYEIDMRLRPSGASGLLVSSINAFADYQEKNAWTWEHQALVRARVLAGCPQLAKRFEAARRKILKHQRDLDDLRQEVIDMRDKMRKHLGSKLPANADPFSPEQPFNLKHDTGGIVDIEFMVQFAVLAYSHKYPELLAYTDNIRLLETIEHLELISPEDALLLREAYKDLRALTHRKALQNQTNVVPGDTLLTHRLAVIRIWQQWVEKTVQP